MIQMKDILRKIDIFTGLDEKLLRKVADTAIVCTYGAEETVIREGEMGIGMYFILKGRVAVVRNQGGAEVRLAEIGAEHFFAEMALIDEKPRSASVVTMEATECLLFTRDTFLRLMEKHPSLSIRLARVLAERLRIAQERPPGTAAPVIVDAPSNNGMVVGTANADPGMKAGIQKKLIETFEMLYTLKALTRFSVAILGCPVEPAGALEVIRVGEVKAAILPVEGSLIIEAFDEGSFQLHLLHPDWFEGKAMRFEPVAIKAGDSFVLSFSGSRQAEAPAPPLLRSAVGNRGAGPLACLHAEVTQ
jgi:CRP-like cAMP-binding protein